MEFKRTNIGIEITNLTKYDNKPLIEFMDDYYQSRKNKYLLIQQKRILINGNTINDINAILHSTDTLTIIIPSEPIDWAFSKNECKVIYEDDFVYIVHKDAGIIIHTSKDDINCLNSLAATYQKNHSIYSPVRPLHRLDQDTQGLVLYSKIPFFQPWFDEQLSHKLIKRDYYAICKGNCNLNKKFIFNQPIGRDRHNAKKYRVSKSGKPAITIATCISKKGKYCLMHCELETGRTHQIRVHLSNAGLPIINDSLYGNMSNDFKDMGLYAYSISFKNPITNKKVEINDPYIHIQDIFGI